MPYKLIILDRDGVINEDSDEYVKAPEEFIFIEGSLEAIVKLNRAGIKVAVATNQSGIARGLFTEKTLQAMHYKLMLALQEKGGHIDKILYCPHNEKDNCLCRKPLPGMIQDLLDLFEVPAYETVVIGDSLRDLQAGQAAGCDTLLVRTGKGTRLLEKQSVDVPVFDDLAAAVDYLL